MPPEPGSVPCRAVPLLRPVRLRAVTCTPSSPLPWGARDLPRLEQCFWGWSEQGGRQAGCACLARGCWRGWPVGDGAKWPGTGLRFTGAFAQQKPGKFYCGVVLVLRWLYLLVINWIRLLESYDLIFFISTQSLEGKFLLRSLQTSLNRDIMILCWERAKEIPLLFKQLKAKLYLAERLRHQR